MNVIYDFGSNNGDDIPYYLKKAEKVIAVEANPLLCKRIQDRFATEMLAGKLVVENCVLTTDELRTPAFFYIHKHDHVLSQYPKPDEKIIDHYEKVLLPSKSVTGLIDSYGQPYYIKIDIEHYDEVVLKALFQSNIFPPYISAESHSIEIFSLLVILGRYNSFKLVDGSTVSDKYKEHLISVDGRLESYSFPHHSAGPFGDDIGGEWMTANNFFRLLAFEGLGWKDIHATKLALPNVATVAKLRPYVEAAIKRKISEKAKPFMPKLVHRKLERWLFSQAS